MSIFNKPFDSITFEDIEKLVTDKVRESQVLEYKSQFKADDVAKTVSAFANTNGGFLIYGITESKDTNEPEKIVGVEGRRLSDTIDNLCYDNITPPVFCERKLLVSSDEKIAVLVVKVPESDLTPHAIEHNTTVYIRGKAQNRLVESKATLDRVEWLKDRRRKSDEFRTHIKKTADQRADQFVPLPADSEYVIEHWFCPLYPRNRLVEIEKIREVASSALERTQMRFLPPNLHFDTANSSNGICLLRDGKYLEFSWFGSLFIRYKMRVERGWQDKPVVPLTVVMAWSLGFLDLANCWFRLIGVRSRLQYQFRMIGIKDTFASFLLEDFQHELQDLGTCKVDDELVVPFSTGAGGLHEPGDPIIGMLATEMLHMYNKKIDLEAMSKWLDRCNVEISRVKPT